MNRAGKIADAQMWRLGTRAFRPVYVGGAVFLGWMLFLMVVETLVVVVVGLLVLDVLWQVFTRFIGFATYQLDSNLRNSTMVGIVGAGGIGGTLFAAFQRFDYDFVCAILISIILMIWIGEIIAGWVRRAFLERTRMVGE